MGITVFAASQALPGELPAGRGLEPAGRGLEEVSGEEALPGTGA
jgi:hypothetical protein